MPNNNDRLVVRYNSITGNFHEEILTFSGSDGIEISADSTKFTFSGQQASTNIAIAAAVASGNANLASYSGSAEGSYVSISGDLMTGFLILSADPTNSGHAATKQYVDAITSGTEVSRLNYEFHNHTSTLNTFEVVGRIIFPGSSAVGTITRVAFSIQNLTASRSMEARLYNPATATAMALVSTTASVPTIVATTLISGVPTGESSLEVQIRRTGSAETVQIFALSIDF